MDVGTVAASFVLTHFIARRFSVPGPGTWAVLCSLAVASWRLHSSGTRWDELGLRMPESAATALAWVAMLFVAASLMKVRTTTAASMGLVLGAIYVCDGRNLVPLIGAHGLADSLSLVAIYVRIVRLK
jgi:hypothetical protein